MDEKWINWRSKEIMTQENMFLNNLSRYYCGSNFKVAVRTCSISGPVLTANYGVFKIVLLFLLILFGPHVIKVVSFENGK